MPINVAGIDPQHGPSSGGTAVTLTGVDFAPGATVHFGAAQAQVVRVQPTSITAITPQVAPGVSGVTVTNTDATTHTLAGAFTFHAPTVTGVAPNAGPTAGNTYVTVTGTYFAMGVAVSFDGAAARDVERVSATQIKAFSPAHAAGAVNVIVTNPDGQNAAAGFTFHAPTVTSLAPNHGPIAGNTPVTITGTHFTRNVTIAFDGGAAVAANCADGVTIAATAPPHAAAAVQVTVTNSDGQAAQSPYTYDAPPTVTGIDPPAAKVTGARPVTLTGTDFVNGPGLAVTFGGTAATDVTFVNATTLTAVVPAHAAGAVNVTATNPDAQSGTLNNGFTYTAGPAPTDNEVTFLMDGEEFFTELQAHMDAFVGVAPSPDTYVRMAFWKISHDVCFGDRNNFGDANHHIVEYVRKVLRAGHNVDIIVWYPNAKDRLKWGDFAEHHDALANALMQVDAAPGAVTPPAVTAGRARIYLERYEGWVGSSNHQKMAIFSMAGQRTVVMGGINLSDYYFDSDDHKCFLAGGFDQAWHDTGIRLVGPATDDVEAEWLRRWNRAVAMQASFVTLNDLEKQVRSRYVGVGSRNTVRAAAVAIHTNRTPQPTPVGANANVKILTTRSEHSTRFRDLRDEILRLIGNAQHYVYMENNQFTDPEIVHALYTRKNAHPGLRIVVVTNRRDGGEAYMTRRSWLQLVLRMPHPTCVAVHYRSDKKGHATVVVNRNGAATWNVHDSYDANSPTKKSWLEDDYLEIARGGGGTKRISFDRILAVECAFHFYTPMCLAQINGPGGPANQLINPCIHSKLAIIDDQYLVVGSSNWTYRSMQYDGGIAAFMDCGAPGMGGNLATQARNRLIGHYDNATALTLSNGGDNFEATAEQNVQDYLTCHDCGVVECDIAAGTPDICPTTGAAPNLQGFGAFGGFMNYVIFPLVHTKFEIGNEREAPGMFAMPNYTWI